MNPLFAFPPPRLLGVLMLAAALGSGEVAAHPAMPAAPAGTVETGAPLFVVLGPEALGLSTAPTDLHLLPDGRVLVVSQHELAFSDGARWETFRALEGQPLIFDSVAVDPEGRIYAGIEGQIARVELLAGARWRFQPAVTLPAAAISQNRTLISVATLPDHWYWYGGNGAIISWQPGQAAGVVGSIGAVQRVFSLGPDVFVSDQNSGRLFRLRPGGDAEQLALTDLVNSESVTCAIPFGPGQLLVGTVAAGMKIFDGKKYTPFGPTELFSQGQRITDLCAAGEGYFAASIDTEGIVFFDRAGKTVQELDRFLDHRLARVQRLAYAPNGVLWGLMNDSVVRVEFPSPVSHFEPLLASGLTYAQPLRHAGQLWVLADGRVLRGIYEPSGRLDRFEDATPPGRYLYTLDDVAGQLFASNENGIYLFEAAGWRLILPGIVNARLGVARPTRDGLFYVARGEYGLIQKTGENYAARRIPAPELGDSYAAEVDAAGIGWIELGVNRIGRLDPREGNPELRILGPADGLSGGWVELYLLDGVAQFHVGSQLYRYDETRRKFEEDVELLARLPRLAVAGGRPAMDGLGRLWYTADGAIEVIDRGSPEGNRPVKITPIGFAPTSFTAEDDGVIWMFEKRRLARMDLRVPPPAPKPLQALITSMEFPASDRQLFTPDEAFAPLNYADNSVIIHFAVPANPFASPVSFEVLLEGAGTEWVSTGKVGSAMFTRLKEGDYVFRVRPVSDGTVRGEEDRLQFTVLPPWFRTDLAWVIYLLAGAGLLLSVTWLSSYLQRRKNARLERLVAQRTAELNATNAQLGRQIQETTEKSTALSGSEERFRLLNAGLEDRVQKRTAELEQAHHQLLTASRQAGMAEVATGVLHNVGNVLNSVNVSATLVTDHLRHSKAANLAKVCVLLDQHAADLGAFLTSDPKGLIIPAYLGTLAASITEERVAVTGELESLRKNIEHIKDIVAMQQSYAKSSGFTETISLPDLVEDALHINAGSLARHGIDLVRDYQVRPVVTLDKHKVMQILINLIRNAKYACDESGRADKRITVRLTADEHCVRIEVSDNGVGIPAENLTRIFNHGFTTRKTGHGFGLHSGALAAKDLGGALAVSSDGPGRGATFTLELPHKLETPAHVR